MDATTSLNAALAGRYEIDREVGRGGMATVYLARDVRHRRNVALKVLDPELGAVLGAERFLSEISVTAGLQHPNLLPLFDSGEADGFLFYVMPYVEGETLRHRLAREKQLPVDEAVRLATSIAAALDYAHRHGVIHRDLKPENILLHDGQPLVADFGIALAVSNAGGARVTQTGLSLGTPQYMSPEQATGDRAIDARTDVYSLAAVLYEMLAGEPPHSGPSAQAIIAKLMTTAPQPLRALRPSVPPNVAMAVEHGLEKLPADRFASAKDFADALLNPAFATAAAASLGGEPPARRRMVELSLGALAAVLLAVALWGWLRPAPPKPLIRYYVELDTAEAFIRSPRSGRIALSPDGSRLVYVGGPKNSLMLRRRDELHGSAIPGTENAGAPFFSPDGNRVGFIQNASVLKIVALDGSPPITVTDSLIGLVGLSWAPDDMIYANASGSKPLVRVAARAAASPRQFTTLDTASGESDEMFPDVLPNNKGVLFTEQLRARDGTRRLVIAIADRVSAAHRVIVEGAIFARYAHPGHLVYVTTTGTLMAVPFDVNAQKVTGDPVLIAGGLSPDLNTVDLAASRTETLVYIDGSSVAAQRELVWATRDGRTQPVDSLSRAAFTDPAISPDGTRLAVSIGSGLAAAAADIWIKRLDNGSASRLTVEGGLNHSPTWARDGKSVFYATSGSGTFSLLEKRADGSAPPVTRSRDADELAVSTMTPDGKWILFQTDGVGASHVLALRVGVDSVATRLFPASSFDRSPALSPDGHWLAYVSMEAGSPEVCVVPFPNTTSAKWILSREGGFEPIWSNRGTEILYRDAEGFIVSVPVATAPTFSFVAPKRLFSALEYLPRFTISHDDARFLLVRSVGGASKERLAVVENWTEALKRTK